MTRDNFRSGMERLCRAFGVPELTPERMQARYDQLTHYPDEAWDAAVAAGLLRERMPTHDAIAEMCEHSWEQTRRAESKAFDRDAKAIFSSGVWRSGDCEPTEAQREFYRLLGIGVPVVQAAEVFGKRTLEYDYSVRYGHTLFYFGAPAGFREAQEGPKDGPGSTITPKPDPRAVQAQKVGQP